MGDLALSPMPISPPRLRPVCPYTPYISAPPCTCVVPLSAAGKSLTHAPSRQGQAQAGALPPRRGVASSGAARAMFGIIRWCAYHAKPSAGVHTARVVHIVWVGHRVWGGMAYCESCAHCAMWPQALYGCGGGAKASGAQQNSTSDGPCCHPLSRTYPKPRPHPNTTPEPKPDPNLTSTVIIEYPIPI